MSRKRARGKRCANGAADLSRCAIVRRRCEPTSQRKHRCTSVHRMGRESCLVLDACSRRHARRRTATAAMTMAATDRRARRRPLSELFARRHGGDRLHGQRDGVRERSAVRARRVHGWVSGRDRQSRISRLRLLRGRHGWDWGTDGGCYTVFVANTLDAPAHVAVTWNGQSIDSRSTRSCPIGVRSVIDLRRYDPVAGLAPNQVAILFLDYYRTPTFSRRA